jgi:hypothetical protein
MASHDPFWGMPEENWQPTSSFNSPIAPPVDDPLVGPLVQLPCVNVQWVPVILGCLSQLTDPGVWLASLTDDQRSAVLNRVDKLRSAMANTVSTPCCNVQLRLTSDCHLQYSVDGGVTWVTASGWDANLHSCVVHNFPPPLPPNPNNKLKDQLACNIAGFLATELIQKTMQKIYSLVQQSTNVDFIVTGLTSLLGIIFPEIDGATIALNSFVTAVIAQTLAEINTVANDVTLWAKVTCCIFESIRADGHLTPGNIVSAGACILGISYPGHVWAPPALSAFWLALGVTNLLAAQSSGALADVDCSQCGPWCYEWDFRASNGGWFVYTGTPGGVWHAGLGWEATQNNRGDGFTTINIELTLPAGVSIDHIRFIAAVTAGGVLQDWEIGALRSGAAVVVCNTAPNQDGAYHTYGCGPFASTAVDHLFVALTFTSAVTDIVIQRVAVQGQGVNPFGADNCDF